MGAGIAHAFVLAGAQVTVVERDADAAAGARDRVEQAIDGSLARGLDADRAALVAALTTATEADAFAGCDLVVEAVPEDPALKAEALTRAEAAIDATAVLATNTSSIGIATLATPLARPHRFVGLHFFNPVPASKLVEVVVGEATDADVVAAAQGWVEALGKAAVTVRDSPGFASSRLGVMLGLEAIRMLEEGVASAADIDAAMELGYRHPMGPLTTTDVVGLDVRLGIAEQLEAELGPRFAPPALLRQMVAEGRLGRKSGSGFYDYD